MELSNTIPRPSTEVRLRMVADADGWLAYPSNTGVRPTVVAVWFPFQSFKYVILVVLGSTSAASEAMVKVSGGSIQLGSLPASRASSSFILCNCLCLLNIRIALESVDVSTVTPASTGIGWSSFTEVMPSVEDKDDISVTPVVDSDDTQPVVVVVFWIFLQKLKSHNFSRILTYEI